MKITCTKGSVDQMVNYSRNRIITLPDGTEYDPEEHAYGYTEWDEIDSKSVQDSDGFWTDYTMWYNQFQDKYVFTFGDKDIYYPENSDWDWECETEDEAWEWFNDYEGFTDDDIQECVNSSVIASSEDDYEQFAEMTATEVVQWMYNKYPQYPFIGETDIGNGRVELQFEMRDRNKEEISYMMDEVGLDCRFSGGVLKIIAPEDDNSTIESSYDSDQLKPFVVRFGWDSGDPENGPSYGYGEDIVYALSKSDACNRWESENKEQIEGLNSGKYGGYEGCFARPATEDDIREKAAHDQEWDELEKNYRFEDDGVYPIDECSSTLTSC